MFAKAIRLGRYLGVGTNSWLMENPKIQWNGLGVPPFQIMVLVFVLSVVVFRNSTATRKPGSRSWSTGGNAKPVSRTRVKKNKINEENAGQTVD